MKQYDYIFLGTGCAGLSLLMHMIDAGLTEGKKIMLIDKSTKQTNDRTWCFWEEGEGFFEPVVYRRWDHTWFHAPGFSKQYAIAPYQYKMIRGIDFYQHCWQKVRQHKNIEIINGTVSGVSCSGNMLQIIIDGKEQQFTGATVFNSLWNEADARKQKAVFLLQHFKGWIIETTAPFFNPTEATLMDFRVSQDKGACFVYVLPLGDTRALIEYTLFSENLLDDADYDKGLAAYISNWLQTEDYVIAEEELGVIPMTSAQFPWYANGMYHIGTAGGQTKASSGYTFRFIQKQSAAIAEQIISKQFSTELKPGQSAKRFHFYDAVLLQVLKNRYAAASQVFTNLFKKNTPQQIFAFLDNETSLRQDLKIIQSLPAWPFLKAAFRQISQ